MGRLGGRRRLTAVTVLIAGLALSVALPVAWAGARAEAHAVHLEHEAADLTQRIVGELERTTDVLRATTGLLSGDPDLPWERLRSFVARLDIAERYPQLERVSWIRRVAREDIESFERRSHLLGAPPTFAVQSLTNSGDHYVITASGPTPADPAIVGVDLGSLAEPRAALEQARDLGKPAVTEGFVQLRDRGLPVDEQPLSLALYVPVFRPYASIETLAERREALIGWVGTAVRAEPFLSAATEGVSGVLQVAIYDGDRLLSGPPGGVGDAALPDTTLSALGRTWTLRFSPVPGAVPSSFAIDLPIALLGALMTLAIFRLLWRRGSSEAELERRVADVTAELRASEHRTRRVLELASEAYLAIDDEGTVTEWNRQAEATFGWTRAEALGRPLERLIVPPDLRYRWFRLMSRFWATGEGIPLEERYEYEAQHRDGRRFLIEATNWLADPDSGGLALNVMARDISERRAVERQLADAARSDPLTGLGNRRALRETLYVVPVTADEGCTVALLDFDRFKAFNDAAGHLAGDAALRAVGCATKAWATEHAGHAFRFGGEEFLLVMPRRGAELAAAELETLRTAIAALAIERPEGGQLTISAGVAGVESTDTSSWSEAIAAADAALYRAKAGGRDRIEVATTVDWAEAAAQQALRTKADLFG